MPARLPTPSRTDGAIWPSSGSSSPTPLPPEPPLDPRAAPFFAVIEQAGADPVIEWGTLSAEVLGLRVARVSADADGAWLEIGIGKHDRLAHRLLWGDEPSSEALSRVVDAAVEARRSGDLAHPLNQLGRERWLRHRVVEDPSLIRARHLEPIAPPTPLLDLAVPLLAPSAGTDSDGAEVLVACSVGFDPTFVPMAAEVRAARAAAGTRLLLVLPEGDVHPLTRRAASGLRPPTSFPTVPAHWYVDPPP